jgi:hypothetical protein
MAPNPKPILAALTPDQRARVVATLAANVDRTGGPDACWPWTGRSRTRGYGVIYTGGAPAERRLIKAHRLAFELAYEETTGELPAVAPVIDHTCHVNGVCDRNGDACVHRLCCNPGHLNAETLADNTRRARLGVVQERCRREHEMTEDNTYTSPAGDRRCRACRVINRREWWGRQQPSRSASGRKRRPQGLSRPEIVAWALGDVAFGEECVPWPGSPKFWYMTLQIDGKTVQAHRLVYEVTVGPIPDGYVLDHTCHDPRFCSDPSRCPHRPCVNPLHLKPVTHKENSSPDRAVTYALATHCSRNHEFTEENTARNAAGSRVCITCRNDRQRQARAAVKAEAGVDDQRLRPDGVCRNGHDTAVEGLDEYGKCRGCTRAVKAAYKQRQRDAGVVEAYRPRGGDTCRRGHDLKVYGVRIGKNPSLQCRECRRLSSARSKQRARVAAST